MKLALIFSPAAGHPYAERRDLALEAERVGLESFWVSDHFFGGPVGVPYRDCLEAWTLLAALARDTTRIRLGVLVTAAQYRNPALLAKLAGVDQMSDGRVEFGIAPGGRQRSTARTAMSSHRRATASNSSKTRSISACAYGPVTAPRITASTTAPWTRCVRRSPLSVPIRRSGSAAVARA